ncbi:uncharacterized protein LOC112081901 [Eutrema salsugineum]|uniref:uncharacterized protein LOC112081901 n=1 Tax=Eutrema salsugineum TaxID=72664 RepID=UPI000CED5986|nr:uncharacterized protein LOC112081901 [Eutrema salsugineum]
MSVASTEGSLPPGGTPVDREVIGSDGKQSDVPKEADMVLNEQVIEKEELSVVGQQKKSGSWAGVVQSNQKMHRYEYKVDDVNGVPTIKVPKEVVENSPPLWETLLVGKFLDTAPYIGKIHVLVNRIWPLSDKSVKIDVFVVDKTTVKFRIKDEVVRNRVLKRRMWNLCNVPSLFSKIGVLLRKKVQTRAAIYFHYGLRSRMCPVPMFAWKGLSFLTSPIGAPKSLHPENRVVYKL